MEVEHRTCTSTTAGVRVRHRDVRRLRVLAFPLLKQEVKLGLRFLDEFTNVIILRLPDDVT